MCRAAGGDGRQFKVGGGCPRSREEEVGEEREHRAPEQKRNDKMYIFFLPPESIYNPGLGLRGPFSSRPAGRGGGKTEGRLAPTAPGRAAPSRGPASLRPFAPPLLFSGRGAGLRRGCSAHARAGRGRGGRRAPAPPPAAPARSIRALPN